MMLPILAQLETATRFADHAAEKDVRWWFVALLVFVLFAFGSIALSGIRYFTRRHDKLSDRLDQVQDNQTKYLQDTNQRLVGVIEQNSRIMSGFSETVKAVQHLFQKKDSSPG